MDKRANGMGQALLTDLYELTMAQCYWKTRTADREAVFHLFFRKHPFKGGFTVACGLTNVIEYLTSLCFQPAELSYLATIKGGDGQRLFSPEFLEYLKTVRFSCDVDAVPEGTLVFPHEPLLRIQGPILQAQIVETALLNFLNFQSLIATKAARICLAAQGDSVIEFGLRRAQGVDGGLTASRAAYIGGCDATSNVLAGQVFGIPVKGTHAHSWVMSFDTETAAFEAYAETMPNNCIFLVDTYDTLQGVRNAIAVGHKLRELGHDMAGIRLDSGDLAYLSIEARKMLDKAGFDKSVVVASNDLDEHLIMALKQQDAAINVWGIGTRLVTAYDQPALGGVYKLGALRTRSGAWDYKLKLSEQAVKVTNPGVQQVRRFRTETELIGDAVYDAAQPLAETVVIVDPFDPTRRKSFNPSTTFEDLLVPVLRGGALVYDQPDIHQIRDRASQQLRMLHPGIKRLVNPHQYPVGLEEGLHQLKTRLVLEARGKA